MLYHSTPKTTPMNYMGRQDPPPLPINSPSRRKSSKSSEVCLDSEHRTVHFNQMVNEDHLSSSNLSTTISSNPHPLHVARKVSFSDLPLVINVEERQLDGLHQSCITTEDKVIYGEDDDSGHHIEVRLLNRDIDEMPTLPSELKNKPVFEIKLGMLKQATVYRTEFTIPDDLKSGELEILRTVTEMDGHVGVPVNVGASFNLLSCEPIPSPGHGHIIIMEISTTKQSRVNELITLRRVENITDAVCLLLHGISLDFLI
ncbi:unnamed protein product [Schistosoma bovis]|nr:unnamed protein product [Schistosoma bovis]